MSKRHPITEVRRWLEPREAEGLSIKQLVLRSGIPARVFSYRCSRDKRSSEKRAKAVESPGGFVEVVPTAPSTSEPCAFRSSGIEHVFPSGLRATLGPDFDSNALGRLLARLRC